MVGIRHTDEVNQLKISFTSLPHDSSLPKPSFVGVLLFKMLKRLCLLGLAGVRVWFWSTECLRKGGGNSKNEGQDINPCATMH